MSNLSMGLHGKLAKSFSWSTFAPLDCDVSTGLSYPFFEQLGLDWKQLPIHRNITS